MQKSEMEAVKAIGARWARPSVSVDDLTMAFGPSRISDLLPAYADIPAEFKRGNAWTEMVDRWVFSGLPKETVITPKAGVDAKQALRHVGACMRSFEPQHEHKTAGCAYLLSQWFDVFGTAKSVGEAP